MVAGSNFAHSRYYFSDQPIRLNIYEPDYKSGSRNVPGDFNLPESFAVAFFKLQVRYDK